MVQLPSNYLRMVNKYPANPTIMPGTQGMSRSLHRVFKAGGVQNPSEDQLPPQSEPSTVPENLYMHNMSVIEDPNAGKLAAIYTPDVIMSASALKCILDNFYPGFSRDWEIPVFVEDVKGSKPGETKRVIFIGKPFMPKQVTASERNKLGFKYSLRTWMNKDWNTKGQSKLRRHSSGESRKSPIASPDPVKQNDDLFNASLDDLESFGEVSNTKNLNVANDAHAKKNVIEDLAGKGDDESDASIGQVDGTVSSLSYHDLDLKNVNLVELLADPNSIVFDPETVDINDKLFCQLDGAVSSDDEDLMIDLGDQDRLSGSSTVETPDRKKGARAKPETAQVGVEETKGRRSTRLRAQIATPQRKQEKTTPKQKQEKTTPKQKQEKATPHLEQEKVNPPRTRTRTRSGSGADNKPAINKKAPTKEMWLSYTEKVETKSLKEAEGKSLIFKKNEAIKDNDLPKEVETANEFEAINKKGDFKEDVKEPILNSKDSAESDREQFKNKNCPSVHKDPASKKTSHEINSNKTAKDQAHEKHSAQMKQSSANQPQLKETQPKTGNILDSLLSGQSALHGKAQVNHTKKGKSTYKGEDMKIGAPCIGSIDDYLPPFPGNNYSYSLWNLQNKNKMNSSFGIIIRSKISGLDPYFGPLVPSVKLEYQTSLGAEQSTVSECCREWCDNLLRPSSTTVRYRIDPQNGKLLMTQKLSLNQIREEGMTEHQQMLGEEKVSSARFDPSLQLANLHNLVTELKGLTAGNYLVSHDKKSGAFCRLYRQSEGEGDYDLHESYSSLDGALVTPHIKIPWKQIDYNLLTPWHVRNDRVPGTFAPANTSRRN